jgi:hypothetical protein
LRDRSKPFLEELMKQIATGVAALVLGATLCSLPALAQQRNPNDGGQFAMTPGASATPAPAAKSAAPTTPYYGRSVDDGGAGPGATGAQASAATSQGKNSGQKPTGPTAPSRSVNDGGMVQ